MDIQGWGYSFLWHLERKSQYALWRWRTYEFFIFFSAEYSAIAGNEKECICTLSSTPNDKWISDAFSGHISGHINYFMWYYRNWPLNDELREVSIEHLRRVLHANRGVHTSRHLVSSNLGLAFALPMIITSLSLFSGLYILNILGTSSISLHPFVFFLSYGIFLFISLFFSCLCIFRTTSELLLHATDNYVIHQNVKNVHL